MSHHLSCPSCGSHERVTKIRKHGVSLHCIDCGHTRAMDKHPHGYMVAKPDQIIPVHKIHPHHFISIMLAFFAITLLLIFLQLTTH